MRSPADVKAKLVEMGLEPQFALGQNFLVNQHVIQKIIDEVKAHPFKSLVEIGPGLGALTEHLLAHKPKVIELDRNYAKYWRERGLDLIEKDALQVSFDDLGLEAPALLVSNLPYQISTGIVIERCLDAPELKWMVLMFQKEVAQRLMAKPFSKEYGLLSVIAQLHFKMRKVSDAAPADFYPAPKIASRVLFFERTPREGLGKPFLAFVKQAFAFRRKFMLKNLKGVVDKTVMDRLPEIFRAQGLKESARAEELAPEQFVSLYKAVYEHKNHHRK